MIKEAIVGQVLSRETTLVIQFWPTFTAVTLATTVDPASVECSYSKDAHFIHRGNYSFSVTISVACSITKFLMLMQSLLRFLPLFS